MDKPDMGLTAMAIYGVGGVAGSLGSGQTYSGAVSYNAGPLGLAAGFIHIDNGNPNLVDARRLLG